METDKSLYVADIIYGTTSDGCGLRNSLYVSGCNLRCKGCHNSHWWLLKSGTLMTVSEVYKKLNRDGYDISILGGEPLMQAKAVIALCKKIKRYRPNITIWLYTGYYKEHLQLFYPELLEYIDVLVDGPFEEDKKDVNLPFRGSSNQEIWRVVHEDGVCMLKKYQ